jgi:hypothetical protein
MDMIQHILNVEEKNCQPRFLDPVKISFRSEGKIKALSDERKQKEFVTSKPT